MLKKSASGEGRDGAWWSSVLAQRAAFPRLSSGPWACRRAEDPCWTRAVEDQSAPIPDRSNERAWREHYRNLLVRCAQ